VFTGIIEGIGRINAVEESQQGRRIHIALGTLAADGCDPGASVSVNGICLTVSERQGELAAFDLSAETLARSTAGAWRSGDAVNLERALALGQRLGGHLVGGHVDGVGRVLDRRSEGECLQLALELPEDGSVRVVEKGSVTVDGISLTVCQPDGRRFAEIYNARPEGNFHDEATRQPTA